ncbi:MAG TPA: arsinothricin resistance N-acetyltransferase ArsN1 family A, partial [Chloroflexota bacterium]
MKGTEQQRWTVRPAERQDASSIAHIYNEGIEDRVATFETEPRSTAQIEARLLEYGDSYPTIVVERAGSVVAWAGASPYSSRPCYAGVAEFSVYTARESRGMGAGRAALAELIRVSEQNGLWKLVSRIFPENRASLALCRSLGFREVGIYRRHAQ